MSIENKKINYINNNIEYIEEEPRNSEYANNNFQGPISLL